MQNIKTGLWETCISSIELSGYATTVLISYGFA